MDCILEAAFSFNRMGMQRKYSFFLLLASLQAADSENAAVTFLMVITLYPDSALLMMTSFVFCN